MPYEELVAEQQRGELRRAAKMLPMAVKSVLIDPISICLNLSSPSATRAEAAFRVARSINTVDGRQAGCSIDDCLPWYLLSSQLDHIRGSHEHALALIARNGFRVHRRSFTVVPIVVLSNDVTITPKGGEAVDQGVINAWTAGLSIIRFARSGRTAAPAPAPATEGTGT